MSVIGKILWSLVVVVLGLIPLWIYLIARLLLQPHGFWQELVLVGLGLWVLGFVQFVFAVIGIFLIFLIWKDS
ncbi:MAG: hypothetical protein RLZZ347_690 [Candidatus Parcubacteria bacterium]|jgi:hypothetical protein